MLSTPRFIISNRSLHTQRLGARPRRESLDKAEGPYSAVMGSKLVCALLPLRCSASQHKVPADRLYEIASTEVVSRLATFPDLFSLQN
jgi:hypothetical protein